ALHFLKSRGINASVVGEIRGRLENEKGDAAAKGGKGGAVFIR
ncbi:MAG: hypothetical protein RL410_709, partial [Actinomycetota bacterium]